MEKKSSGTLLPVDRPIHVDIGPPQIRLIPEQMGQPNLDDIEKTTKKNPESSAI